MLMDIPPPGPDDRELARYNNDPFPNAVEMNQIDALVQKLRLVAVSFGGLIDQ